MWNLYITKRFKQFNGLITLVIYLCGIAHLLACQDSTSAETAPSEFTPLNSGASGLSLEEILDAKSCQSCHPEHYAEWRASVHAYASEDPVFQALNRLGQLETDGELGDFCVQCHAPVAVALKKTTDGLNLDSIPEQFQGITCAYCHQITDIQGSHNNPLIWSNDGIMRGGIKNAKGNGAHASAYSKHLDGSSFDSSALCGSCHDIVTPTNVHLEQTYLEWQSSFYSHPNREQHASCNDCHMPKRSNTESSNIGTSNGSNTHHDHLMPAVDLVHNSEHGQALLELNGRSLKKAIQDELNLSLLSEVCGEIGVNGGGEFELYLENVSAGHRFPSGAALDRRVWVEFLAFDHAGELVFESGQITPEQAVDEYAKTDSFLWLLKDEAFNQQGSKSHRFWEIESVTRNTLPPSTLLSPLDPNYEEAHVMKRYRFASERPVYEVQIRVFIRAIAYELLQELIDLDLLSADFMNKQETFEIEFAYQIWRADEAIMRRSLSGKSLLCTTL